MSDIEENKDIQRSLLEANRKGKKSGGFQSMGLSYPVYKAIGQLGYKIPTPIQRKTIPLIIKGKDVVAMARTGSGKTAAFLIPLIEKLKAHSVKVGARGLVLSPSRELAYQTLKFTKDLGKHTDLRATALVGGDQMEDQFAALAGNPDIIIATPGRLMHLIIEMNLDFSQIEYVVFDECDRLFEQGFAEQLHEILRKLPASRQTLLFSATLPKLLVEFAKAGLSNPTLVRLDVDSKISQDLQMFFFSVKHEEKEGALLYLLKHKISKDQQTILFVSTKHHVDYIHELLTLNGYASTYIYGSLDQVARKQHLDRFRAGKSNILVVTDVAARGIDIPFLDHVINYDFPISSKVFVHRVGRTARAGKMGSAWSLVAQDELPFMLDLQLFTGRPLVFASVFEKAGRQPDFTTELVYGLLPSETSLDAEVVLNLLQANITLSDMKNSSLNGYKMYIKSRPPATKVSYERAKEIPLHHIGIHPAFETDALEKERNEMVASLSKFRPSETIFEVGKKGMKTNEAILMAKRRQQLQNAITKSHESTGQRKQRELESQENVIQASKKQKMETDDFYLSYRPEDDHTEAGYAVNAFSKMDESTMDLVMDDDEGLKKQRSMSKWDSKKHRFSKDTVGADNKKMFRSDSGKLLPATWNSNRYSDWKKKTKLSLPKTGEKELDESLQHFQTSRARKYRHNTITAPNVNSKSYERKKNAMEALLRKKGIKGDQLKLSLQESMKPSAPAKTELKSAAQIAKQRTLKEQRRLKTGRHKKRK